MASQSGHTLEILVQARDMASAVFKQCDTAVKEFGQSAKDAAKQASTALVDVSGQADKLKVSMDEVASSLAGVGVAATAFGASVLAGFGLAIKSASDFETSMTGVKAVLQSDFAGNVSGLNSTMGQLTEKARELGTTTQFSAVQAGNAMEELAKAGYKVNDIMASSDSVLKLAALAQMNLGETAEAVVNILTPFGLKAQDAASATNTLAVVANETTSGMRDITEAMKFAAPAAASLGLDVNETAAAIGVLSDSGMKGTIAGTSLRGIFIDLVKPTKQAQEALKNLGVELVKNNDGSVNAIATFKALRDAQMTLADSAAIFGVHQATAALALAKGVDKFGELTEKTRTQTTALDDLTKTVTGSFEVSVQKLISSLKVLGEALGTPLLAPLKDVVLVIIDGVKWLAEFARAHETLTKYIMGAIGVVGGIATVFGAVSLALAGLIWALGAARQAWVTLIAVWERGIVLSLKSEAAALSEAVARERNAAAALKEAEAIRASSQAKATVSTGGIAETARGAIPGIGVAAGIGGAAFAHLADWDKDLKGINTSLLDISAIASMLPGKFGAIGQAVTAWGSAISFTVMNWQEIAGFLKDDLGIIGRLWVGMVDIMVAPFKAAYDAITGVLRLFGVLKKDIPDVTQSQKDFTKASVEMGESWAQFQKSYQSTFGTKPPDDIARQFAQLRREAIQAGESGKEAGKNYAAGMTEAATATRLTATEQQALEKQSKELAKALTDAFKTLKDQTAAVFGGINDSIRDFQDQWSRAVKQTEKTSKESQIAFSDFAKAANDGLGNTAKYITEQMGVLAIRLRSAIDAGALKPEIEACSKMLEDFANLGLQNIQKLADGWKSQLRSTYDEIDKITKELSQLDEKYQKDREGAELAADNAIRELRRSTLTDLQKFQETLDTMRYRQEQAQELISLGGLDNLKEARQLMLLNIQDAQRMKQTSVTAWDQMSEQAQGIATQELAYLNSKSIKTAEDVKRIELINSLKTTQVANLSQERAAEIGVQQIEEARARLAIIDAERQETEKEDMLAKKRILEDQAGVLQSLLEKAETIARTLKEKLAVTLDTSAAEEALKTLTRPREIDVKMNVTSTGDAAKGMATGGALGGYGGGDIIPAWLEPGEFVVRKEAVSSVGVGVLNALNSFGGGVSSALRSVFSGISVPRFAGGGFVDNISTRVADGLDAVRSAIEMLIDEMRQLQGQIQTQNAAYAGSGGGSYGGNLGTLIEVLQSTAAMNRSSAEAMVGAAERIQALSNDTQKVEVRVQDGIGSTRTDEYS